MSNSELLLKLIKKYNPSFSDWDLTCLLDKGCNSVFLAVMNDIPHEKKARQDADKMQRLFYGIN